jgi:lysozyme
VDKRGVNYTKTNEGYRSQVYRCTAGKLTFGWGTHIDEYDYIPKEVSQIMFKLKYAQAELDYEKLNFSLNPVRRIVIIDMIYNLGLTRFMKFQKMISAIHERDFDLAADELEDSLYFRQVGHRGLQNSMMMRTGDWQR